MNGTMINRTFEKISDEKIADAAQQSFMVSLGWSRETTWADLLRSPRILIVSEAGAGKTFECQSQAKRLWSEGEPAFFIELAALANEDLCNLLDSDEEARLEAWLASQSEVATFFLDSIDELKLTLGSFERALKRFRKCVGNQLHRIRIVITTRPVSFDKKLVQDFLPVPAPPSSEVGEDTFARIAMGEHKASSGKADADGVPNWQSVALMPLSDNQILEFCREQGVGDPDELLQDLQRRNAQEFARRPQDLIELCADWKVHKRVRKHKEQVAANIGTKLLPRDDRPEPAELSLDRAIEGASRLALAMQVTRRLTIRHSAAADDVGGEAALDPARILSDWLPNERKALLERPLFGFASYGRVRFHHRSVVEYLAAQRLLQLLQRGMPFRALQRLLFAETKGKLVVRPSKRPLAGWLALNESKIFGLLRDHEPAVLLNEGDPESLSPSQRIQALRAYVNRYGAGGWRGLEVPYIQVYRFSSVELAEEINGIWHGGVENPDVREIILNLIEAGTIRSCANIPQGVSLGIEVSAIERLTALDALIALNDETLEEIAGGIADADDRWPEQVARGAILRLFPKHMSVEQLCRSLRWIRRENRNVGDLSWQLPRLIAKSPLDLDDLEQLRDGFVELMSEGLRWQTDWPHMISDRPLLSGALAATCVCALDAGEIGDAWLQAGALTLRLHHRDHGGDEPVKSLHDKLSQLNAEDNARLFWIEDALIQSLHQIEDPWRRLIEVTVHDGPIHLNPDRDLDWVCAALGKKSREIGERAMLLEAAMSLAPNRDIWREHVRGLRSLVEDNANLLSRLEDRLRPSKYEQQDRLWKKKRAAREKQEKRRKAKDHASWIQFWRKIANNPEQAFSTEQSSNTVWNLWRAMSQDGDDSRASGWNRRFIEEHFGRDTADRLRTALMKVWREDWPTLWSERPRGERNTYLTRWQLGLAGIYAEAEDGDWAKRISQTEARLAARYSPIELNGLPQWMGELASEHPDAVEQTLGDELSWELAQEPEVHCYLFLLQSIRNAPTVVAELFLPRLKAWLDLGGDLSCNAENPIGMAERIRRIAGILTEHGDQGERCSLLDLARQRLTRDLPSEMRYVWLSVLMHLDPVSGVGVLEAQLSEIEPEERGEGVTWFACLFGDRSDSVNLSDPQFTPQLLLRLMRLAYRHVRLNDDAHHEGSYSPDTRDDAERARNYIVTALFNAKGEEGLAAKLEAAGEPMCEHFKDRIVAVAEEKWAEEIDAVPFDEQQAVMLDQVGEAPANTNEAMFALLKDRLSDLDDLLLHDDSPRDAWAGISQERVMRREIARELGHSANSLYTVDQEAVTADEKETDIRLRSVSSNHQATIELKLGDYRAARDLRDTIEDQLLTKYMAAENSRAGALLITLARDRVWDHPDEGGRISVDELLCLLRKEAERLEEASGGTVSIVIHLLDLRPRLAIEAKP